VHGRHISRIDFDIKPDLDGRDEKVTEFLADIAHHFANIIRDEDSVMGASQQEAAKVLRSSPPDATEPRGFPRGSVRLFRCSGSDA
jgi:hypothetical protein